MTRQHPYLAPNADGGFIAFAHRGGSPSQPENSLAAFRDAWKLGYRYLETDVQVTADGVLVAFHDDDLQRTCGIPRRISHMTWSEVASARIDGREPIPRLVELLEEFPEARFNIDAKIDESVNPLIETLTRSAALDRVCVGSFDHLRLIRIRAVLGDRICTSASPREVARWVLGQVVEGPSCLQVPLRHRGLSVVTRTRVQRAQEANCPVHVWTIDEPHIMQRLIDLGVHGIMTDRADVLRAVARSNALWPD